MCTGKFVDSFHTQKLYSTGFKVNLKFGIEQRLNSWILDELGKNRDFSQVFIYNELDLLTRKVLRNVSYTPKNIPSVFKGTW